MKKYLVLSFLLFTMCSYGHKKEIPADYAEVCPHCLAMHAYKDNTPRCPECGEKLSEWRCPEGHGSGNPQRDPDREDD